MTLAAATGGTLVRQWKALALGRPTLDGYLRHECAAYTPVFAGACHPPYTALHVLTGTPGGASTILVTVFLFSPDCISVMLTLP